ncbi:MAG TPA: hypothetical protein VG389_28340 [Myxococcota bacterium]|jgi:hypothetical protein|nr:hypothetical protein [Myxococcota bacterium]
MSEPRLLRSPAAAAAAALVVFGSIGCTCGVMDGAPLDAAPLDAGGPGGSDAASAPTDAGPAMAVCAPPGASVCGNTASIVRGVARIPAGVVPAGTSGTLVVALTHVTLGSAGSTGGFPHTDASFPGVDLTAGATAEFSLDMCTGGEMWSTENGEFNVDVFLDLNLSGSPDPGEPAHRSTVFLSCMGSSPCLDVPLDCTSGLSCITYADVGCTVMTPSCPNPVLGSPACM